MSKATLAKALAEYFANKDIRVSHALCNSVVDSVFTHIAEQLQSVGRFAYPGFGTFRVKYVGALSSCCCCCCCDV